MGNGQERLTDDNAAECIASQNIGEDRKGCSIAEHRRGMERIS
jgi:hypothetical protein